MPGTFLSLPKSVVGLTTGFPDQIAPGSGLSGPYGIEAVLEYRESYFNVRSWLDTYLITQIDGLADADVRDTREANPGRHGETPFNSFYGGRTIAITGTIRAHTRDKMRDMQQGLRQVFSDITTEHPLIFRTGDPYKDLFIFCKKVQSIQMTEIQKDFTYRRDFLLTLRASNPRFLSYVTQVGQYSLTTTTFNAVAFTAVNQGNFAAQPIIQIYGPANGPVEVANERTSQKIRINPTVVGGSVIAAGRFLEIDTAQMTMKEYDVTTGNFVANRFDLLDISSSMIDLEPGDNSIAFVVPSGGTSTTKLLMRFRHTVM
jgi:phage-related protein